MLNLSALIWLYGKSNWNVQIMYRLLQRSNLHILLSLSTLLVNNTGHSLLNNILMAISIDLQIKPRTVNNILKLALLIMYSSVHSAWEIVMQSNWKFIFKVYDMIWPYCYRSVKSQRALFVNPIGLNQFDFNRLLFIAVSFNQFAKLLISENVFPTHLFIIKLSSLSLLANLITSNYCA